MERKSLSIRLSVDGYEPVLFVGEFGRGALVIDNLSTDDYFVTFGYLIASLCPGLVAEIIASIDGAGSTKVMLTMESTVEQVFAENKNMSRNSSNNTRQQSDTVNNSDVTAQSSYITLELSDGSQQTVLLKEIQPRVRGVLIVCSGGDNEVVKAKITDAVTKTLDISSSRVSVAGLAQ